VTKQFNNRIQEHIFTSTNIDSLSKDLSKYRRDSRSNTFDNDLHSQERRPSSPPTSPILEQEFAHITCTSMNDVEQVRDQLQQECDENKIVQDMIDRILKEAEEILRKEVNIE
jgi:hypothetical protein